jgi:hypothetical protein
MSRRFLALVAVAVLGVSAWHFLRTASEGRQDDLGSLPPLQQEACGVRCGVERWAVKTLSDGSRSSVDLEPVPTTIAELAALPRPTSLPNERRVPPVETTVYRIRGYLVAYRHEDDHDFHVVLADMEHQRVTMITEIPDPACGGACASGFGERFAVARAVLDSILHTPNPNDAPIVVEVTGVGFFDREHGQAGAAPNNLELHPVLSLARVRQ